MTQDSEKGLRPSGKYQRQTGESLRTTEKYQRNTRETLRNIGMKLLGTEM